MEAKVIRISERRQGPEDEIERLLAGYRSVSRWTDPPASPIPIHVSNQGGLLLELKAGVRDYEHADWCLELDPVDALVLAERLRRRARARIEGRLRELGAARLTWCDTKGRALGCGLRARVVERRAVHFDDQVRVEVCSGQEAQDSAPQPDPAAWYSLRDGLPVGRAARRRFWRFEWEMV